MVFKRVLKGIGRLMLTTAVMCGVGLFLCSSEVKAAQSPKISIERDSANKVFNIYLIPDSTDTTENTGELLYTLDSTKEVGLFNSADLPLCNIELDVTTINKVKPTGTADSDPVLIAHISDTDFLTKVCNQSNDANLTLGASGTTVKPKVFLSGGGTALAAEADKGTAISAPIYEVKVAQVDTGVSFAPGFTQKFDGTYVVNGRSMPYGYENESYTVKPNKDGFDLNKYYHLVRKHSFEPISTGDDNWMQASYISGTIKPSQDENELDVAYFPIISKMRITGSTAGTLSTEGDKIDVFTTGTNPIISNITYEIVGYEEDSEIALNKTAALGKYSFFAEGVKIAGLGVLSATTEGQAGGKCRVEMGLENTNNSGSGNVTISAKLGNKTICSAPLAIYLGVKPTGILLQNVPISVMAGGNATTVKIFNGIEPSGANQSPSAYTGTLNVTPSGVLDESSTNFKYNSATGEVTVKASSTATSGATATVTLTLDNGITPSIYKSFEVKIISFDKDKTIDSIQKSNKNYITYNKDKGYSLDIKQLIIDNAKDSNGNSITIDKSQITDVKVDGSSCSDGLWKPSEAVLNKKVIFKLNGSTIDSDSFKVSAYPMPTATYSSSNRTLTVKIPTKVSTAYSDDNNIRQSKGFKLLLVDSSGNTLYEYTDSKYQSVLSSSSESTVSYTVTASDIEGMITSAASNGKFSADTTSVKFKVIPMGYKQSSSSDETIKAKDEIAGTTDAVTVYKVSASGTNFSSTAAYGLDGQTVSLTATPNSGYTFKQWSDGNTSNPRQIKVSASGTRSFQAVAGERVANSTGAGGTDNSALYDDVPKTSESNSAIWLIVFMVFAVMGTTYALYLQLRAANSKHDR